MIRKQEDHGPIEEELIALLRKLLAELPINVASLHVRPVSDGIVATLKPTNPVAAPIVIHVENRWDFIDFSFGEYEPTWELPYEGHNRKPSRRELLHEVEEMCRAVMAGHCEHTRGFLSVGGTIHVGSRPYRVRHMPIWRVTPAFKGTRKYEPYVLGL